MNRAARPVQESAPTPVTADIYYFNGSLTHERRTITAPCGQVLQEILRLWLTLLEEEVLHQKIALEHASFTASRQELIISYDRALFTQQLSLWVKYTIIESLLMSLKQVAPELKKVHILVHGEPMQDIQLDFSRPWVIDASSHELRRTPQGRGPVPRIHHILIEPVLFKDARDRITVPAAYFIQDMFAHKRPDVKITVVRGQDSIPYQPDLVIRIGTYEEKDLVHHFYIGNYQMSEQDQPIAHKSHFLPAHAGYLVPLGYTQAYGAALKELLTSGTSSATLIHAPLAQLKSLTVPALYIEWGFSPQQGLKDGARVLGQALLELTR